ncbi:MAG TPA: SDR family NAD(P)-dependent oxidoreductase, partial [Bdellovibrionales bacterium]|nr:SDR family NAD(P)-dependent oxidoreductase [Bdellovibrionales bacterium]
MLLKGKVVIVTGAGGGLGRTHALAFAKEGAKVVVNDLGGTRDGQGGGNAMADAVVNEIKAMGGEAVANYDSVADVAGAERIIQAAVKTFGRLDILVNNAGILRDKTLTKMEDDQWHLVQKVHLDGTFYCGRAAARYFVDNKIAGRIINTSSIAGLKGNFGQTNYAAAKAGIAGMTRVWSMELAKYNITCNAIAPMAKTRMTEDIEAVPDDTKPEHISPLVVFLATDLAADVNGQIFGAHGGHYFEYKTVLTEGVKKENWTVQEIAARLKDICADAPTAGAPAAAAADAGADDNSVAGRINKAFKLMEVAFTADKAAGWSSVMHFMIEGADNYTVEVNNGTCKVTKGTVGTPTCKITTKAETMAGMIEGKISGQSAFMSGKIKASNMGDMIKFGKVFDFKRAREAAAKNAPAASAQPAANGNGAATASTGAAGGNA